MLAGMLEKTDGVEEVVYYKDVIGTFQRWSYTAKVFGMALVGILSLISVLVVLVTIGSAIHSKKEEIVVMRLIGASDWYIQGPFLAQGVFYGLCASILSSILMFSALPFLLVYGVYKLLRRNNPYLNEKVAKFFLQRHVFYSHKFIV